ncbi:MAG: OsmC family protein [Bacteroidota bacterium]|nr:OsmC family protein [Bacteroidota bacterium]
MASHHITSIFKGGMEFAAELNGHQVTIDLYKQSGGNNLGPEPKALMLVSLAGCTGVDVVMILNKMRVQFSEFFIDVDAELTDSEPKVYDTVKLTYKIKVNEDDKLKVEKAVDLSQNKYCGVSAMFKAFAKLETEIVYG